MRGPVQRLSRLSTGRLVTIVVATTIIPLAVLTLVSVNLASAAVRQQAEWGVRDSAAVSAALVEEQMAGLTEVVNSFAERATLVAAMGGGDPARDEPATINRLLLDLHRANAGNAVAFVSDRSGRLVDAVPTTPSIIGSNFSYRDWYRGVIATGRPYVSEAYETAIAGRARVVGVAAPIRDAGGQLIGILVAGYDVGAIQGFVKGLAEVQGLDLTTTDQRGTLLSAPGQLPPGLVSNRDDPSVAAALRGQTGVAEVSGRDGEQVEGYAAVPGLGWTVRTDVPASVVLASVSSLRNTVLAVAVVLGIALFGILGLLYVVLRRRAQQDAALDAQRRQAAESDALFTLSLDMFAVIGADGYFKRLNAAWPATLGHSIDDLTARPFVAFVHPDDVERTASEAARLNDGGATVDFENRYRHADGSYRTLSWSARGQPADGLIYAVARDVTVQKEIEDNLRRAREQAMDIARMKSDFLANMSHEIRTPMNGVIGMTDLLLATPLSAEQAEYAEIIRRSGDGLLGVINDILDFSKIESGRLEIEAVDVDLRCVVEDVAEMVAAAAHRANLEMVVTIDPALPAWVIGDPGRLRQVLLNLVSNAVKFTEAGEVVIGVHVAAAGDDTVAVRFEVTDTGIGISPQTQAKLFTAFTQADASTTRQYGGTGLGLAISSQLVGLMGGTIGVDSEVGSGSTFWFTVDFPASSRSDPGSTAQEAGMARLIEGLRVLVVDDNSTNRTILTTTLASWGAVPRVAGDGAHALQMVRDAPVEQPYGLVLLDYMMPGMDGLEVARRISEDRHRGRPRVILLTSAGGRADAATRAAGIDATLSKPVRQSLLYDTIVTVMAGPAAGHLPPSAAPSSEPRRPGTGRTILVAEDNAVNQVVAVRMLERLGYRADVVADGAQAVAATASTQYAALLMDCQMPVMDGFAATAEIRRREGDGGHHLTIIAMTAGAMDGDAERCLAAGMDGYLSKPVKSADLARVLESWLSGESPVGRAAAEQGPVVPLDQQVVADLRQLSDATGGDLFGTLVEMFSTHTAAGLARIRAAVGCGDAGEVAALAHGIRGGSGNLGASVVADLCRRLESAATDGDLVTAADVLAPLEEAFERARSALDAEVAAAGGEPVASQSGA